MPNDVQSKGEDHLKIVPVNYASVKMFPCLKLHMYTVYKYFIFIHFGGLCSVVIFKMYLFCIFVVQKCYCIMYMF